jgi:hypothetical protein
LAHGQIVRLKANRWGKSVRDLHELAPELIGSSKWDPVVNGEWQATSRAELEIEAKRVREYARLKAPPFRTASFPIE